MSNKNRVILADAMIASGYDKNNVLDAIGYPECTSMSLQFYAAEGLPFGVNPDDDAAIYSDGATVIDQRRGAFTTADPRRWNYSYVAPSQPRAERLIKIGSKIDVVITDSQGGDYSLKKWRLSFGYSDGSTRSVMGGMIFLGESSGPFDGSYYNDAYDNGGAYVPPPYDWPMPKTMQPPSGSYVIPATGARIS